MSAWIDQIFEAGSVAKGNVVRRNAVDVMKNEAYSGELLDEVRERGFHMVKTGDQVIVICNSGELSIVC